MAVSTATRNSRIRASAAKGVTLAKLAKRYNLTSTRVWQIAHKKNAV